MSEATPAAQLFWPILAIVVTGSPGSVGGTCLILLSAFAAFLHPTSALIFAFAALYFARQAWTRSPASEFAWLWAGGFAAATVGAIMLTLHSSSDYERSQASVGEIGRQFRHSVSGFPLFLLFATYLLGALLLAADGALRPPFIPRWIGLSGCRATVPVAVEASPLATGTVTLQPESSAPDSGEQKCRYIRLGFAALLLAIAGAGCYWARDPTRWNGLLDYRRFVLPAIIPLVLMAAWHRRCLRRTPHSTRPIPTWLLPWVAAAFSTVLITQSFAWELLLEHFARELSVRSAQRPFIPAAELSFTRRTPLQHWTACPLSVLLQDRQPSGLFVLKSTDIETNGVQVNPWEEMPLTDHWFKLCHLARVSTDG